MKNKKKLTKEEVEIENKSYYQIDKKDIYRGIQYCQKNSEDLYNSSEATYLKTKNTGTANSLLILAVEECIKGIVLISVYCNVQVPFEIKPIFRKHEHKHVRGKELHHFVGSISKAIQIYSSIKEGKFFPNLIKNIIEIFNNNEESIEWWNKANDNKNRGFYVDFNYSFQSPEHFPEDELKKSRIIGKKFVDLLGSIRNLKEDDYLLLQTAFRQV